MSRLDSQNRAPKVEVQPDFRLRVTDCFDVLDYVPRSFAKFVADVRIEWGTPHPTYPECRLTAQTTSGQIENGFKAPNDPPPQLFRIYDEIPRNDRVIVGDPGISFDQYGRKTVVIEYLQFSDGSTVYTDIVGTTAAPAPNAACILKTLEAPDDGTLIRWKLTFIDSGQMADDEELRFGGKLLIRTLTYLNEVPPTPAGYTLVTKSVEYIEGLPLYRYGFVRAGSDGLGGGIGEGISYGQSVDEGVTAGTTTYTLKYVTDLSVTTNPFTAPAGTVLIDLSYTTENGYKLWTGVFVKATGTVSVDTDFRSDGSIVYTVTTLSMVDATPAYPGSGTGYNVSLTHTNRDGYIQNVGVWIKPPPTRTYRAQLEFDNPGQAYFVGTDLILQPGAKMQQLGFVEVSFSTTQSTTQPFFVQNWGGFIETYTPVDTGIAINNQFGLIGYLTTGTSSSGTGMYKGVDCTAWSYQRFSSTPSSLPTGTTLIGISNVPYLTDIAGTVVFKITKESVSL